MKRVRVAAAVACVAVGGVLVPLLPTVVAAQPGGPYTPLVLLLPSGARPLALGNVGVASRDDDVLFYNPAQLIVARGTSGSYERYSASSGGGALSSVTRFSNTAFGIGFQLVDYKTPAAAIVATGGAAAATPIVVFPLDRGSSLDPGLAQGMAMAATVGFASTIKSIRVGVAAKYAEDEVPAVTVRHGAVDVGLARDFFRFYTLALSVQNIGESTDLPCVTHSEIGHENCQVQASPAPPSPLLVPVYLPLRTTLGGSFTHQVREFDLVATAAVSMLRANAILPAGGAELGYSWLDGYNVALRAGLRRTMPGEGTITGGAGLTMDHLSIDYAIETLSGSHLGQRLGLRLR